MSEQFVPVKLNAEQEGRDAARHYGVQGLPLILFLTPAGEVENSIQGFLPPDPFAYQMQQVLKQYREFPQLLSRFRSRPGDTGAAAQLVAAYTRRGNPAKAAAVLARAEKANPRSTALASAYIAVGESFVSQRRIDQAIPHFRKAATLGKQPAEIAYARLNLAACYLAQQKNRQAVPEIKAALAVPKCPAPLKQAGQRMLEYARRQGGG